MDIVFHDRFGTRIHGKVNNPELEYFENRIKEGEVCALKNFCVTANFPTYKTCRHPWLLVFTSHNFYMNMNSRPFLRFMFDFEPFESIGECVVIVGSN
ncbi:hypothetical protein DM860_015052 [Cuscuta australis]|uniref:Replication protein A 70 kDa DNA-binding subunit B/D first OB fold domain-containing protein n=1 Tax=Cuscuta australis TaxID=267555 RepID=A0A328DXZ2_9ASTE|nr:hypothetical protein DM860_015052 [Cuscuta australis]